MSAYTDKIDNHAVHTNLKNVQDELETVYSMQDKLPVAVETLARISMVVKNFSLALENCNKNLVAIAWLEDSSKALANIKSYLSNYESRKEANALANNSAGQLDILLQASVKLNCVKSTQNFRGIVAAENEYTRVMDLHNEQLHEKVRLLEGEI